MTSEGLSVYSYIHGVIASMTIQLKNEWVALPPITIGRMMIFIFSQFKWTRREFREYSE